MSNSRGCTGALQVDINRYFLLHKKSRENPYQYKVHIRYCKSWTLYVCLNVQWNSIITIATSYTRQNILYIAENFQGKKLLRISQFCGYPQKLSPRNLGAWHPLELQKRAIRESFLCEIVFFTNSWKFSPSKDSRYTVSHTCHGGYIYVPLSIRRDGNTHQPSMSGCRGWSSHPVQRTDWGTTHINTLFSNQGNQPPTTHSSTRTM